MSLITGKRVKAEQKGTGMEIPLAALYSDFLASPSDAFIEQLRRDIHILAFFMQLLSSEDSSTNCVSSLRMHNKRAVGFPL